MTTTTIYQGMEPGAKNSSRVLRPPGGASNISFGTDEEKPPIRKDKMASTVFAEDEDLYAHRRNNPPGGKAVGVLVGEPSAPPRRVNQSSNPAEDNGMDANGDAGDVGIDHSAEPEPVPEPKEEVSQGTPAEQPAAGLLPSGRRNPPGGKSSLILG